MYDFLGAPLMKSTVLSLCSRALTQDWSHCWHQVTFDLKFTGGGCQILPGFQIIKEESGSPHYFIAPEKYWSEYLNSQMKEENSLTHLMHK